MRSTDHQKRINAELSSVGVSTYGQHKRVSRNLPNIIASDEHIHGVVYGWSANGFAMIVATDHRILYLLRGLLTSSMDELAYDVVSGVQINNQGILSVLELHTRIGDYRLSNINNDCAKIFANYVETRFEHLDNSVSESQPIPIYQMPKNNVEVSPEARRFLVEHDLAVLSTTNLTGDVWGAVVYYLINDQNEFFILTKSETTKAHNMLNNQHIGLTIYDPVTVQTVQLQGVTEVETSKLKKDYVYEKITQARIAGNTATESPVTKIRSGSFMVFHIIPTNLLFHDYSI
jgi:uncharacterized protein YhbP (UPF0306 family)